MNDIRRIQVLIADDHPIVREGVAAILNRCSDIAVVAQAGTGREAVEVFRLHHPDITLMDLRMPEMDGVSAIETIRREFHDARIVAFTTYDGDEDIYRAVRAGAKAYLVKDAPREQLLECIRTVDSGAIYLPSAIAVKLAGRVSNSELTTRELEVLRLMAVGKSNKEIGGTLFVTEGTVKAHVNKILSKLAVSGRTEAVASAFKRGIVRA
jgi:two-component system NarL family response regulator